MEQDELDFLNELAEELFLLVDKYASDPRVATLAEKVAGRIRTVEAAEEENGDDEPVAPV